MAEFESAYGYSAFARFVKQKARYILDADNQTFIELLIETSKSRKSSLPKGTLLWRAQLGSDWQYAFLDRDDSGNEIFEPEKSPYPYTTERMIPLPDRAYEGRVNPKGIPCLYLATDRDTAMSEVRPSIGSYVSVAQFVVLRALTLVDCSSESIPPKTRQHLLKLLLRSDDFDAEHREISVWSDVNEAFAAPVNRTDDLADYAPTQLMAEAFQRIGFEGIKYSSHCGKGWNIALFDLTAAEPVINHLYKVQELKMTCAYQESRPPEEKYKVRFEFGQEGRAISDATMDDDGPC